VTRIYVNAVVINGIDFCTSVIERIHAFIKKTPSISRVRLSRRVCEMLDWRSANGRLKEMACRVALLKLERNGVVELPKARRGPPPAWAPKVLDKREKSASAIACSLAQLGKVELVKIGSADSRNPRLWRDLMIRHHYLGAGPLCGAQMRYLIFSETRGWLGGLAFSAAAWSLKARDEWIGWSQSARKKHLYEVVCNSRFLILPHIKVPHLASHVLGKAARRILQDWPQQYGYTPLLLETFVERERFAGVCYRAANWIHVGCSSGRGRQDRRHGNEGTVKDVYVFPLCHKVRTRLCQGPQEAVAAPPRIRPTAPVDWAEEEFLGARLGDERLEKRLITIGRDFYARPQGNIPQACDSRSKTKAAYRFFEHPQTSMEKILQPHYESTIQRIGKETVVLVAQDTTSLNYSTHPATENLGLIGSKADGIIGLVVHDTMAFNTDGTPLGLLDVQCWARDPEKFGKKHLRKQLPIEEKESYKWLRSYKAVVQTQKRCPKIRLVSVGDREADIYELFELALSDPANPWLLVRAEHDRALADGQGHMWDYVSAQPLSGKQEVAIPRRGNQKARHATLEVRFANVRLKPPRTKSSMAELTIWAVITEEVDAPNGVTPLKWMLLTTRPLESFECATEVIGWYCRRWGIEIYHKTLKSGCKIETRQLGAADRIEACLAIDMVVAWRIFHLTKLGRETPDVPCTVFFEDAEWKALVAYKTQNAIPPANPPTLREATRMVASLGGFLGRKGDGEPGTQTIWLGLQRLDDIVATWKIAMLTFAPHLLSPPVSSAPKYG
jgi:hypothetical protein